MTGITIGQSSKNAPAMKDNELLLSAVGQIMHRNPNASEDLVRTTLYSKHPDAARLLAKTPSFEHETRIVRTAIYVHQQQKIARKSSTPSNRARRPVWIG